MAEIEHFCDPKDKSHPKFDAIKDVSVPLYSACAQMDGQLPQAWTFGDAVEKVNRTHFTLSLDSYDNVFAMDSKSAKSNAFHYQHQHHRKCMCDPLNLYVVIAW